jgi:creatinine amidohydrolase
MENFPWTRLGNVAAPAGRKPPADPDTLRLLPPSEVRARLGDGNFGGLYQRADEEMLALWQVAVDETRALIKGPWA